MNNPVLLPLLLGLLLPAAWFDIRSRCIPNALCLAGCVAGLLLALAQGGTPLGASLLGMMLAFSLAIPLWLCRWLGAGDVKLLAAVGALAGSALLPRILVFTALSGALLSLLAMLWLGQTRATLARLAALFTPASRSASDADAEAEARFRLPYAVAIAVGSFLAVLLPAGARMPV